VAFTARSPSDGYGTASSIGLGYPWEDPILPGEDAPREDEMELFFLTIWLFFIANVVLVVWALVDAIRVPDESMYRAGNKLIWVLVILFAGFIGAIIYLTMGRPAGTGGSRPGSSLPDQLPPPPPGSFG
jgi:hypothetical protein